MFEATDENDLENIVEIAMVVLCGRCWGTHIDNDE